MSDPNGNGHDSMDLSGLPTGEASRSETLAMAGHLRTCDECRFETHRSGGGPCLPRLGGAHRPHVAAPMESEGDLRPFPPSKMAASGDHAEVGATEPAMATGPGGRGPRAGGLIGNGLRTGPAASGIHGRGPSRPPSAGWSCGRLGVATALAEGGDRVLTVRADQLDALRSQTYYEVWLLEPTTSKCCRSGCCLLPAPVPSPWMRT